MSPHPYSILEALGLVFDEILGCGQKDKWHNFSASHAILATYSGMHPAGAKTSRHMPAESRVMNMSPLAVPRSAASMSEKWLGTTKYSAL